MTHLAAGQTVPDFVLKNTSGSPVRLSEYQKGIPLLLAFYKHECPTCQLGIPFVERIHQRSRPDAVRFLGVMQDGKDDAAAFAKTHAIRMPFVLEEAPYDTARAFALTSVPTVFLLDSQRRIERVEVGFSKKGYQALADRVAALSGTKTEPLFQSMARIPDLKPG